jgi:hypothetical protein
MADLHAKVCDRAVLPNRWRSRRGCERRSNGRVVSVRHLNKRLQPGERELGSPVLSGDRAASQSLSLTAPASPPSSNVLMGSVAQATCENSTHAGMMRRDGQILHLRGFGMTES